MLNRKEFLEKSAIFAGTLTGAMQFISLTRELFAEEAPPRVATDLAFIDIAGLGRTMERIDTFGDPGEGAAISSSFFKPDMELSEFCGLYCAAAKKLYGIAPDKNGSCDGTAFALFGDTILELLQSLITMAGNSVYGCHIKSMMGVYHGMTVLNLAESGEIVQLAANAAGLWKSLITSHTGKGENMVRFASAGLYQRDYQPSFNDTDMIGYFTKKNSWGDSGSWSFLSMKEDYMQSISTQRYLCRAIYSRYSMLSSFEKYMASLSNESEKIYGSNEITAGARQLLNKVLCTLLFLELCLSRMKLLAHRSRSGIFSDIDRFNFQQEFGELAETVNDIAGRPSFGGKKLFGGLFDAKPAQLKSDKLGGHIRVPLLNCTALGIRDKNGRDIISVSTQGGTEWAMEQLDLSLKTIDEIRSQVLTGAAA